MKVNPITADIQKGVPEDKLLWFYQELNRHIPYGLKVYADNINDEGKRITEIFNAEEIIKIDNKFYIDSKETIYRRGLDEIFPILFDKSALLEKITVNDKTICPLDEILSIFSFDRYIGYYTRWRLPDDKEIKRCNSYENNVIVECFGEPSVFFDIDSFIAKDYKTRNPIESDLNYYRYALDIFSMYHIDYRNIMHNMGLAITPQNNVY